MASIFEIVLAAAMFIGSWGFSFGYSFDNACSERDFFIPRQVGVQDKLILNLNEDGTAEWIMDDEISYGQWTNEEGLEEYQVFFPEKGMTFSMDIEQETWDCADEGMLVLTDNEGRTWNFSPVRQCGTCSAYVGEENLYCPACGAIKPED